jgi:hypothetical protein
MHLPPFRLPSGARCEASQRSQRRCSQPVPQLKLKRQRRFEAAISAPDPVRENAIPIFGDADRQLMARLCRPGRVTARRLLAALLPRVQRGDAAVRDP